LIMFLTVFLMVSGLINVQAAAKAGSKCQKSGIKAKVGGNNFICTKSGKKLLWKPVNALPAKVVIDVKKTYSTDDGYFDKFTRGACEIDPYAPTQWLAMQAFTLSLQNCAGQVRLAKYNLGRSRPTINYQKASDFNAVQPCKISGANHYSLMHRTDSWAMSRKHPGPNTIIQLIPIYAEDTAQPKNTPAKDYEKFLEYIKEWADYSADFGSNVQYRIPDEYIKLSGKVSEYKLYHPVNWDTPGHVRFNKDVIATVDSKIDFTGAQMAIVVAPAGTDASIMQQAALGSFQTSEGVVPVGLSQFGDVPNNPRGSEYSGLTHPFWWIHEAYHAGYGFDDHYGDARWSINSEFGMGWWTMMTPWGGDLSIWEKWLLGFVQDSQIQCTSAASSGTHWIAPSSVRTQESKAVVIPISSTKVIVAESIRAAGLHYKVPTQNQGVLIYEIDLTKNTHGMGMKLSLPTNRIINSSYPFFMADAALRKGDTTTTNGITFTIIESGTFGDVIKVSKE
jgi:hypothetical protein